MASRSSTSTTAGAPATDARTASGCTAAGASSTPRTASTPPGTWWISGEVDGDRLLIAGGSAGGYTTLCALTFHDDFAAGASYFGISDLEPFAKPGGTHKFESQYEHTLVGPYPEAADLYRARSPIHFVDLISCPMILLQGAEDEVVPPSQAEIMVHALEAKGLPYAYLLFEGEQHGFRKAESIVRSREAELSFYAQILGFEPGDEIEPVSIANL